MTNHLIIKLLFALLLVLITNSAAAEWALVFDDQKARVYFDYDRIQKSGNMIKIWNLMDIFEGSKIGLTEYNCTDELCRELYKVFYTGSMGEGRIYDTDEIPSNWKPPLPETLGENLWKIACGKHDYIYPKITLPLSAAPNKMVRLAKFTSCHSILSSSPSLIPVSIAKTTR